MDSAGQVPTLKEGAPFSIRTIVWTFLDRSRPNFQPRGGKTGGPSTLICNRDWRSDRGGSENVFRHEFGHSDTAVRGGRITGKITRVKPNAFCDAQKERHPSAVVVVLILHYDLEV